MPNHLFLFRLCNIIFFLDYFNDNIMTTKQNIPHLNNHTPKITPKLPSSISIPHPPSSLSSEAESLQQALMNLHSKRTRTHNNYEAIISSLKQIVQELLQRNEFLLQDRDTLLRENHQLRKKNESLSNILDVKRRLGDTSAEQQEIYEILVESASVTAGMSKIEESVDEDAEAGMSRILPQVDTHEHGNHVLNRNQFAIASMPLSYNISQMDQNEISMSNIGRTNVNATRLQTPGLARQNIFLQCSTKRVEGVIRSFYLSILQRRSSAKQLMRLIDELSHDITVVLYQPYPTNHFWTGLLCNFIKTIHQGGFENQIDVLKHIKEHRLLDTLLINSLRSRVEFLFQCRDSFEPPSVQELLGSLGNEFNLRMEVTDGQFLFFTREAQREELLLTERASLQISLNNKSQNKYYVRQEEPFFVILHREDSLQLSFFIVIEQDVGLSQYQINEENTHPNHSFQYSQGRDRSMVEHDIQGGSEGDHLANIANILNERDMNAGQGDDFFGGSLRGQLALYLGKEKKLTRNPGHRRYSNKKSQYVYQQPLSSSRYFLNRVSSKHSSLDQHYE